MQHIINLEIHFITTGLGLGYECRDYLGEARLLDLSTLQLSTARRTNSTAL